MAETIVAEPQAEPKPEPKAEFDAEAFAKQITEAVTKSVTEQMTTQFKSQIDGLNRKVTDQEKEKEALAEAAKAEKLTVEERLEAVEKREQETKREMESKDRAAALREKQLQWDATAAKLRLPKTHVDPSLSLEDGEKYLTEHRAALDAEKTAEINEALASGRKPGSGNVDESTPPVDLDAMSRQERIDYHIAEEEKKLEARAAANRKAEADALATMNRRQ